jgi:protein ImuA
MSPPTEILSGLRQVLRGLDQPVGTGTAPFATGAPELDDPLGGGLARGALHEIHAEATADAAAASAFAALLALRAAGGWPIVPTAERMIVPTAERMIVPAAERPIVPAAERPIVWVRQDYADVEAGSLHAPGLAELGIDPDRVILVRGRNAADVLRGGAEALRCASVGAVLMEPWGEPKVLDLTATRRLSLAAAASGVTLLLVRVAAKPAPSAAMTRWAVRARPSAALEANAPGLPAFALTLLRHRAGLPTRRWDLEWDRDRHAFRTTPASETPLPRPLASFPAGGAPAPGMAEDGRRRAG